MEHPSGSILPPSDRRRRLGRRLRSFRFCSRPGPAVPPAHMVRAEGVPFPGQDRERPRPAARRAHARAKWPVQESPAMELTWYGRTCIRLRGKDAVVVNDPYPAIVGPTGRGITGDVVTYSHPDEAPPPKKAVKLSRDGTTVVPTSLEPAFVLDGPGEYEVHDVLLT